MLYAPQCKILIIWQNDCFVYRLLNTAIWISIYINCTQHNSLPFRCALNDINVAVFDCIAQYSVNSYKNLYSTHTHTHWNNNFLVFLCKYKYNFFVKEFLLHKNVRAVWIYLYIFKKNPQKIIIWWPRMVQPIKCN